MLLSHCYLRNSTNVTLFPVGFVNLQVGDEFDGKSRDAGETTSRSSEEEAAGQGQLVIDFRFGSSRSQSRQETDDGQTTESSTDAAIFDWNRSKTTIR